MLIFPAIDLMGGSCVRLQQGKGDMESIYDRNPVSVAEELVREGAKYLHIIDLDAAFGRAEDNANIIEKIRTRVRVPIQVGGGIRSLERAANLISIGIDRLIVGTRAVTDSKYLDDLLGLYGERIAVSVDAVGQAVSIKGWTQEAGLDLLEFCSELKDRGVANIIYTDIERDGMLTGLNFEMLETLQNRIGDRLIAAGGVKDIGDFYRMKELGIYGAITGKALYEGRITMDEIREFQNKFE